MSAGKKSTPAGDETPYEALVAGLEEALERLEGGELSLEEALVTYEQGAALASRAQEVLDRAEQRIQELRELDGE
ncbi:MAG: exodeoxyribonuclease VII small subunit [Chloroflexi bacterium]|nr:MAG: exodeoxyribonuclease VII small subunit [Chloroflexota bacterium]